MSEITRRDFIKIGNRILVITGVGVLVSPVIAFFYPSNLQDTPAELMRVGKLEELPENEATLIKYGRFPTYVLNTPEGLRAYSAVCTHFACIVKWNKEIGQFACPCHAGFYDPLDGHVISGPPPRPLTSFPVTVVDGVIYVGEKVL